MHLHLPVDDMTAPSEAVVSSALAFIDNNLQVARPVAVHCAAGYGRTGTILACYLVHRTQDGAQNRRGYVLEDSGDQRVVLSILWLHI